MTNPVACLLSCRAAPNACKIQHFRACQATEIPSPNGSGPGPGAKQGLGWAWGGLGWARARVLTGVLHFDRGFRLFDRGFGQSWAESIKENALPNFLDRGFGLYDRGFGICCPGFCSRTL